MTILPGMSGYDYYTDSGTGWEVAQGIGRAGGGAIHRFGSGFIGGYITGVDDNPGGALSPYFSVDGFYLKTGDSGVWSDAGIALMCWSINGVDNLFTLATGTSGDLTVWRYFDNLAGTRTLIATISGALADPDTYYPLECKVIYDNSDCEFIVRINGAVVLDTMTGAGRSWSGAIYHQPILNLNTGSPSNFAVFMDDIYALDNSGSYHTDFLGPAIIDRLNPTGLGVDNGTDSANIDDPTPDGATTSIDFVKGFSDSWDMTNLAAGYAPVAAQVDWNATAIHVGGTGIIRTYLRTPSTFWTDSAFNQSFAYGSYSEGQVLLELNPATAAPWTTAEVNDLQVGVFSDGGSFSVNGVNVTQMVLEVLAIAVVSTRRPMWGGIVG